MLAIEAVIPNDLDRVPIERIIKVRKDHGDEFDAFRTVRPSTLVESLTQSGRRFLGT
jgi:hypothetical protein